MVSKLWSDIGLARTKCNGQNQIYPAYVRYFWQGNHQLYGHVRCVYTVLTNPSHILVTLVRNEIICYYLRSPVVMACQNTCLLRSTLLKRVLAGQLLVPQTQMITFSTSPCKLESTPQLQTLAGAIFSQVQLALSTYFVLQDHHRTTTRSSPCARSTAGQPISCSEQQVLLNSFIIKTQRVVALVLEARQTTRSRALKSVFCSAGSSLTTTHSPCT